MDRNAELKLDARLVGLMRDTTPHNHARSDARARSTAHRAVAHGRNRLAQVIGDDNEVRERAPLSGLRLLAVGTAVGAG